MNRTIVCLTFFAAILLGCKTKHNESSTIDSTMVNADGVTMVYEDNDLRLFCLQDKATEHPADLFSGSFNDSLLNTLLPEGKARSSINAFLVSTFDHTVLVDAGLGVERGGNLLAKLQYLKVKPEDVDAILLTHLHPDHIGGLLCDGQATFPSAQLFLSVDEFNAWADGGEMSKDNALWKEVLSCYANRLNLFMDGDTLVDGLAVAMLAPGHTPGHSVFRVGQCLMAGDLVHAQDIQFAHPQYCARYDHDHALAVTSRMRFLSYSKENNLLFCGAHCYEVIMLKD